jgi:hypothetical protein
MSYRVGCKTVNYTIGQLAMYGPCTVRINSSNRRGIAAPHYRFSCTDSSHEHPREWGTLTSYELLRPIKEEWRATGTSCPECERALAVEATRCRHCSATDYQEE